MNRRLNFDFQLGSIVIQPLSTFYPTILWYDSPHELLPDHRWSFHRQYAFGTSLRSTARTRRKTDYQHALLARAQSWFTWSADQHFVAALHWQPTLPDLDFKIDAWRAGRACHHPRGRQGLRSLRLITSTNYKPMCLLVFLELEFLKNDCLPVCTTLKLTGSINRLTFFKNQ